MAAMTAPPLMVESNFSANCRFSSLAMVQAPLRPDVSHHAAKDFEPPTPSKTKKSKKGAAKAKDEEARKLLQLKEISDRINKVMEDSRITSRPSLKIGLASAFGPPVVMGDEYMMSPKGHGTSSSPVQRNLRWGCDHKLADNICNFNRRSAEESGYFEEETTFLKDEPENGGEVTFYDSNTGKPLFWAPRGRTFEEFVSESKHHGWPSFRDEEVNWTLVRVLMDGETISVHGTHLGHNLPDANGNRYCINLVSVAGRPIRK